MSNYVIIGDGAAGITAAQAIRSGDPGATITVLAADPNPHYYRAALTNYLLGQLRDDELWGVPPDFYARHQLGRYYGQVVGIDSAHNTVALANGQQIPYDTLLIASGASPTPLPAPGAELPGVMTFRTLQDARRLVDLLPELRQAVVVGGGTLGLEWVQGLRHKGVDVTYLLRDRHFMSQILDETASEMVLQELRAAGVRLVLHDEVATLQVWQGWVGQVITKAGLQIPCQLVGAAIGVRPNVAFMRDSGVEIDRGVLVDAELRTNLPNVYAAGDVAQVRAPRGHRPAPPSGLWQPARTQGRLAGWNMAVAVTGQGALRQYEPGAPYVATHLYDLDFAAIGETRPTDTARLDTPIVRTERIYRKLLLRDGRLIGVLLIGDRRGARTFKRLIDLQIDLSPVRARLLDEHFDLARWTEQQVAARAPQRIGLTGFVSLPGARAARQESGRLLNLAADPTIAIAPRLAVSVDTRRAARLLLGERRYGVSDARATTVGRAPDCDIILDNSSVSRRHAEIVPGPDGYALRDLNSANGSWVGLTRSQPNTPQVVRDGDLLRFGEVSATFALGREGSVAVGAPSGGAAKLVGPAGEIVLTKEITSLGRAAECDVVVGDERASRLHAQIVGIGDGDRYLRDMGSANGTLVNGARVFDAHLLQDGDTIGIGSVTYAFRRVAVGDATVFTPAGELTILRGNGAGTRHPLRRGDTTIGRDPGNTIALADPLATRRHAVIASEGDTATVRDLGSANGTWVNGARLTAPRALREGDTIAIGQTTFAFRRGQGERAPVIARGAPATAAGAAEATRLIDQAVLFAGATAGTDPALEIVAGAGAGRRFTLRPGTGAVIGRDDQNPIQLHDSQASRRHAEVVVDTGGTVALRDLGSSNGTLVNGRRIVGSQPLYEGDEIRIGDTTLRFTAR